MDDDSNDDENVLKVSFPTTGTTNNNNSSKTIVNDNTPVVDPVFVKSPQKPTIDKGEFKMADVDTNMLSGQHADIRREAAINTSEIIKETVKAGWQGVDATKDARHDVINNVDDNTDRVTDQATAYFIAGQQNATEAARDLASLKTITDLNSDRISTELALNVEKVGAASALQAEKIASAVALGQSMLSKEIFHDGQKTRDLINDIKYHDLNRALIERNTELVEEREGRRHWRYQADQVQSQSQWAALQSQLQAFQSQLQETRQGMVNFGTMAGVGQTSTSNNVR